MIFKLLYIELTLKSNLHNMKYKKCFEASIITNGISFKGEPKKGKQ